MCFINTKKTTRLATKPPKWNYCGVCRLLVAFLFNWIGFCLSFCLTNTIAGRYGAICGFGLSLIKWILIVRVSFLVTIQNFLFFISLLSLTVSVFFLLPSPVFRLLHRLLQWAVLALVDLPAARWVARPSRSRKSPPAVR